MCWGGGGRGGMGAFLLYISKFQRQNCNLVEYNHKEVDQCMCLYTDPLNILS